MTSILDGYWPSPWPAEDGGPARRQSPAAGTVPLAGGLLIATSRPAFMGCMPILRGPGEVYLQGHSPGGERSTAWVERIDPRTLRPLQRSADLPGGRPWPGGLAAHANGSLYATFGRWCHRLAPDCSTLASRELPRERPYNSLLILPDGHLVMKDFAGGSGVHALPPGVRGSELVVLEPERLEIVARLELPEGSIARLSADVHATDGAGAEVYVVGDQHVFRVAWDPVAATLTVDDGFTTRYLDQPGQTFGWDAVLADGSAWFLDNGEGTTNFGPSFLGKGVSSAPLHLVRVPLHGERRAELTEICGLPNGIVANPPCVDPVRKVVVGFDSGNGVIAAFSYADPDIPLEPLWRHPQNQAGHMLLYPSTGEFVSYDFDHTLGTEQVVVRDIETGRERARVPIDSPLQCVVFPACGFEGDLYVATFSTIARVSAAPA
jgi:hypothetical protein